MRSRSWLLATALLTTPLAAQTGARPLSLEEALGLAIPASEALDLARAAITRARGEQLRARAERYPQLNLTASYQRLLRSQFEGFSLGGEDSEGGTNGTGEDEDSDLGSLPFGRRNTYNLGLQLSQNLFAGGRILGAGRAADAQRRSAELGLRSAAAQVTLEVAQAYYDAVAAEQQVRIAETALAQADTTLRQTEQRRAAGTQPEFDLLRARVARDNQRTTLIQRQADRDVAYLSLKRLLGIPLDQPLALTTELLDVSLGATPTLARALDAPGDTSAEHRVAVRLAAEAVAQQEGLLQVTRSQQLPQLVFNSQYGNVAYPESLSPFDTSYFTNWNFSLSLQIPIFTGGRIQGEKLASRAGVEEARARLRQAEELARVDARSAMTQLSAALAAWSASDGTIAQAERAYQIAELRFREGLSTQTELLDARLALQNAESVRLEAARALLVARIRLALISELPLQGSGPVSSTMPSLPRRAPAPSAADATALPGMTP